MPHLYRESLSNILEPAAREARELFLQGRTPEAAAIRTPLTPLSCQGIPPTQPSRGALAVGSECPSLDGHSGLDPDITALI